jgi:hypothetical protein
MFALLRSVLASAVIATSPSDAVGQRHTYATTSKASWDRSVIHLEVLKGLGISGLYTDDGPGRSLAET